MVLFALMLSATAPNCESYVGQAVSPSSFEEIAASLPTMELQGDYESTLAYEARLAQTANDLPFVSAMIRAQSDRGLSYDADEEILQIYETAFGATQVNFSLIFGPAPRRFNNYVSAVGFLIDQESVTVGEYEASNAFGGTQTVTQFESRTNAIWERAGELGQRPIVSGRRSGPLARVDMSPANAQDVIENGSAAFLLAPRPPFLAQDQTTVSASLRRPSEGTNTTSVIIADIQCAFLLNGNDIVSVAFEVR